MLTEGMIDYAYSVGREDGETVGAKLTRQKLTRHVNTIIDEFNYDGYRLSTADSAEFYDYYLNGYLEGELKAQQRQEEEKKPKVQISFLDPFHFVRLPKKAMEDMQEGVYWVIADYLDALDKVIKKYTKKAQRIGVPAPSYEIVGTEYVPVYQVIVQSQRTEYDISKNNTKKTSQVVEYKKVALEGEAPQYKGWEFLATIQPIIGSDKALLLTVPDVELPAAMRDRVMSDPYKCDHCKKARRRNETFLLYHEDDQEWVQVGRSCLKDFLGHKSPQDIAAYFGFFKELVAKLSEGGESSGSIELMTPMDLFYAELYHDWKAQGGYEKGMGSRTGWGGFWDKKAKQEHTKEEKQIASEIRAEILNQLSSKPQNQLTGYEYNVLVALSADYVSPKSANLVGSSIIMYERRVGRPGEEKEEEPESQWLGELREKLTLNVTCVKTRWIESMYGTSQLCIFLDDQGNELKWFNSGRFEAEIDTRYKLTGTVKKHETYRDKKSTMLTRCKLVPV